MKKGIKKIIKKKLKSIGLQITRFREEERIKIINQFGIDKLFDVGANIGQYSLHMREIGFSKKIISFEPLKVAFLTLKDVASKDTNWVINNYALGNEDIESIINVSGTNPSSSILNMLPEHTRRLPDSRYVAKENIVIKKLDTIFNEFYEEGDNVMLKIDTQGYEKNVILGAENVLNKIRLIQLEMSIIPLYENEILFIDMIIYLNSKGFELYSLENGFSDLNTGRLLQIDGLFVNKNIINKF